MRSKKGLISEKLMNGPIFTVGSVRSSGTASETGARGVALRWECSVTIQHFFRDSLLVINDLLIICK